jgi:hypothetical protein
MARRVGAPAAPTTLDILKIFRTVKSRVLRSASPDIEPANDLPEHTGGLSVEGKFSGNDSAKISPRSHVRTGVPHGYRPR